MNKISCFILSVCAAFAAYGEPSTQLERDFANPPNATKPRCYWYWMDGHYSKEGITRDLEAMKRFGIGEAYIGLISGQCGIEAGEYRVLSEPFWDIMFYFLWLEQLPGPYDVTKILAKDPQAMSKPDSPLWGPMYAAHHWGESIFGYYIGDDDSVLRKHAQMLGDAGVDVIIFDTSNKLIYPKNHRKLFEVFEQMRQAGNRVPQVAFLTPFWDPRSTVRELYDTVYSKKIGETLWFKWDGKPLILADPKLVDEDIRGFFTFRKPQPDYFQGPTGPDMWSWLEVYPQHVFTNSMMPKGGQLFIQTRSVVFDEEQIAGYPQARAGRFVCLSVSDTGCGMDENTLKKIFDPFFTTKEAGKGTGLGLATVHGIVAQHSGWVDVVSKLGQGTTFRVYLPECSEPMIFAVLTLVTLARSVRILPHAQLYPMHLYCDGGWP